MAAAQSLKTPPLLTDDIPYQDWKSDLTIWQLFTELDKKKQGPALYLSLSGKARECVRALDAKEIGGEGGFQLIVTKLDAVFIDDVNLQTFNAFKCFYDFRRPSGMTMKEFIITYESLYHKVTTYDIKLPQGVQSFFVLTAANISEENERLARVSCAELKYQNMKETLLRIFSDPAATTDDEKAPAVKMEPVFKVAHRGASTGVYRGRGRGTYNRTYNSYSGTNPTDREGKVMKCFKCGSEKHFARYCDKGSAENTGNITSKKEKKPIYITLLSRPQNERRMSKLLRESLGMAVLDTGCSRTVAGEDWVREYEDTLTDEEKELIESSPSQTSFVFGDGVEVNSSRSVKLPVTIGSHFLKIDVDVVSNNIPLLFSRPSMERGGVIINTKDNTAEVLGEEIKLVQTSSGHLCLPLTNKLLVGDMKDSIVLNISSLENCTKEQKRLKAMKLHKQFSHASKEKLLKLVKSSKGFKDKEFLECIVECCNTCPICKKFQRPPLRPVVTLPLANDFNEVVCMDLKEHIHNKSWILHLIDSATKYSVGRIVYSKKKGEIVQNVFSCWIAYFGSPRMFLSDNGGEFNNEEYREMNEQLNIHTATTAAESPFSNGIVERHNLTLAEAMKKTMSDEKCKAEVALSWALAAKNALHSSGGVSPNMMVFGRNANFPNVLTDKLPALEPRTESEMVRRIINTIHVARQNYVKAESSEKIRRALRSKVRNYVDVTYEAGEQVYYRRKNFKGWKGPATVLGVDGKIVMLRHGGQLIRVHLCHLMKDWEWTQSVPEQSTLNEKKVSSENHTYIDDSDDDAEEESDEGDISEEDAQESFEEEGEEDTEGVDDDAEEESDDDVGDAEVDDEEENADEVGDAEVDDEEEIAEDDAEEREVRDVSEEENQQMKDGTVRPIRNHFVKYKLKDSSDWKCARILSSQPKKTGIYSHWINIKTEGEDPECLNWDNVSEWCNLPYPENFVLLSKEEEYSQEVVDAKHKELQSLKAHKVYKTVPYCGQKLISSRWVLSEKYNDGEKIMKARLVARGYEENSDNLRKDSPTCSREGRRLVYLTAAINSWKLQSLDFTSAFLQGEQMNRSVYLRPPRDVCDKHEVWELKKCIYGLNDAPRSWYIKVKKALMQLGGTQSAYDSALFIWHNADGTVRGIIASHVDDFIYTGNKSFQSEVIENLKVWFKIGQECEGSFKYVGLSVIQGKGQVKINQDDYISTVEPIEIPKERRQDSELTSDEKSQLKSLAGKMIWAASQTRPDVAYETCVMANTGQHPTVKMVRDANKAVTKLKSKSVSINFRNLGKPKELKVKVYSDATHDSLQDGSSQGGFLVFLEGTNGNLVPMSWQSKKLHRVTKSPLASETLALGEGADAGFLVASMVKEVFGLDTLPPISCITDNSSLVQHLHTSKISSDRRLRVDMSRLREMVQEGEITVSWCPGKLQLSDCLTKNTASSTSLLEVIST